LAEKSDIIEDCYQISNKIENIYKTTFRQSLLNKNYFYKKVICKTNHSLVSFKNTEHPRQVLTTTSTQKKRLTKKNSCDIQHISTFIYQTYSLSLGQTRALTPNKISLLTFQCQLLKTQNSVKIIRNKIC